MDIATIIGLVLAFGSLLGGNALEGGHIDSLLIPTAALIVYGGTFGAVFITFTLKQFMTGMKRFGWIFFTPKVDLKESIDKIVDWANIARKDGLLELEGKIETETDPFTMNGLQMVVDGTDASTIIAILETKIESTEKDLVVSAKVWEALGGYAPTLGIIGAVMGLIHVMGNLSDPSALGSGIAVAFVATIYGLVGANLFFLPAAAKIKAIVENMTIEKYIIMDGLAAITDGDNPRNIEAKLNSYVN